jgi:hypothetical protein
MIYLSYVTNRFDKKKFRSNKESHGDYPAAFRLPVEQEEFLSLSGIVVDFVGDFFYHFAHGIAYAFIKRFFTLLVLNDHNAENADKNDGNNYQKASVVHTTPALVFWRNVALNGFACVFNVFTRTVHGVLACA